MLALKFLYTCPLPLTLFLFTVPISPSFPHQLSSSLASWSPSSPVLVMSFFYSKFFDPFSWFLVLSMNYMALSFQNFILKLSLKAKEIVFLFSVPVPGHMLMRRNCYRESLVFLLKLLVGIQWCEDTAQQAASGAVSGWRMLRENEFIRDLPTENKMHSPSSLCKVWIFMRLQVGQFLADFHVFSKGTFLM